jgi:hypothetical protein
MNIIDIIEILKITFVGYFIIDSIALIYIWFWKETHYQHRILFSPTIFTGVIWITSDYKKIFESII